PPVSQPIKISPINPPLSVDIGKLQFKAWRVSADKSIKDQDVTSAVTWASSADHVVSIDHKGLASAKAASRSAKITARDPSSGFIASTDVPLTGPLMPTLSPSEQVQAEIFADMEEALSKTPPDEAAIKRLADAGGGKALDLLVRDYARPDKVVARGGQIL